MSKLAKECCEMRVAEELYNYWQFSYLLSCASSLVSSSTYFFMFPQLSFHHGTGHMLYYPPIWVSKLQSLSSCLTFDRYVPVNHSLVVCTISLVTFVYISHLALLKDPTGGPC